MTAAATAAEPELSFTPDNTEVEEDDVNEADLVLDDRPGRVGSNLAEFSAV